MGKESKNKKDQQSREEDFDAIRQVLAGNKSAFQHLQNKYVNIVSSLIRRMINDEDDVQDLTQDSFIKAYNALDSFQFQYSFSSWLYRIASNTCIDFLRKRRFKTVSINQPIDSSDDEYYMDIRDDSYSADDQVLANERKQILHDAIDKLPENYREIIKLRHEEEMDYKEISNKLNLPLGTVKAHLFRARKMLLEHLQKNSHLFSF